MWMTVGKIMDTMEEFMPKLYHLILGYNICALKLNKRVILRQTKSLNL